jgi:hypothetical protein
VSASNPRTICTNSRRNILLLCLRVCDDDRPAPTHELILPEPHSAHVSSMARAEWFDFIGGARATSKSAQHIQLSMRSSYFFTRGQDHLNKYTTWPKTKATTTTAPPHSGSYFSRSSRHRKRRLVGGVVRTTYVVAHYRSGSHRPALGTWLSHVSILSRHVFISQHRSLLVPPATIWARPRLRRSLPR